MEKSRLDFVRKITDAKDTYYANSTRNTFFKKQQKYDCANTICENVGLDEMIDKTFYVIPNTNKVYMDYTIFKLYAIPENFDYMATKLLEELNSVAEINEYEIHVNMESFTISAYDRYKDFISIYCNKCLMFNTTESLKMSKMYIYNTPMVIDTIAKMLKPIMHPGIHSKTVCYNKKESPELLVKLLTVRP